MENVNFICLFFWTGVVSTFLFVLKLLVFLVSGGLSELNINFDSISESDASFNFLTIESILSFFMGLGWIGLTFYKYWKMPLLLSVVAGIFFGLLFAGFYTFLLFNVKKLDETPIVKDSDYLGATGKAYTRFLPHNCGQAELVINDKFTVVNAFNDTDEEITAFTPVKVVKKEDGKIYIEIIRE